MKQADLGELMLKLAGLWLFVYAVTHVPYCTVNAVVGLMRPDEPFRGMFLGSAISHGGRGLVSLLLGILLLFRAEAVAKRIFRDESLEMSGLQLLSRRGFRFLLRVLGVIFFFMALLPLGAPLTRALDRFGVLRADWDVIASDWVSLVGAALQMAFAAALVFGAERIADWVDRADRAR